MHRETFKEQIGFYDFYDIIEQFYSIVEIWIIARIR